MTKIEVNVTLESNVLEAISKGREATLALMEGVDYESKTAVDALIVSQNYLEEGREMEVAIGRLMTDMICPRLSELPISEGPQVVLTLIAKRKG